MQGIRVIFSRISRGLLTLGLLAALLLCSTQPGASAREPSDSYGRFVALSGREAHEFEVPDDVREVQRSSDNGLSRNAWEAVGVRQKHPPID